ncbi:MAG: hypothetical protein IT454_08630 [Planctomycetes bacterium]|nr:hypothetical protein [Planctomycetota bacterium]
MQVFGRVRPTPCAARQGSALLMAFLMIILLYAIVFQLSFSTKSDLRVAENDVVTTQMDMAIESALQEVFDRLKTDAESAAGSESAAGGDPAAGGGAPGGAAPQGDAPEEQPADSRMDSWGRPQRSTIGEIEVRVLIQDEDSKVNLLQMLAEDEEERDLAFDRVVRVIDMFRDGSTVDVDRSEAIRIAEAMREHLRNRSQSALPQPKLLTDDEENKDIGLPLTLKEFEVLDHLDESLFRDFRDEHGYIVHSLGAYLTVWSAVQRGPGATDGSGAEAGGSGANNEQGAGSGGGEDGGGSSGEPNWGVSVNVNTAPVGVLKALIDDRVVSSRFWDAVIEYRNLEKKEDEGTQASEEDQTPPQLDEYGQEIVEREFFDSLDELQEVDGFERLDSEARDKLLALLCTQSHVFSIYVTARKKRSDDQDFGGYLGAPPKGLREDLQRKGQMRTVRCVVWRYKSEETVRIVPIVRWEVLDYTPFEVVDYPDEDR